MVVSANLLLLRASALLRAFCRDPIASSHSFASPLTATAGDNAVPATHDQGVILGCVLIISVKSLVIVRQTD